MLQPGHTWWPSNILTGHRARSQGEERGMCIVDQELWRMFAATFIASVTDPIRALTAQLACSPEDTSHLIVGIGLVGTLGARVEDRGRLVSATRLSLAELHLRVVALRASFIGDLLCVRNVLRNRRRGEAIALALKYEWVVSRAGGCTRLIWTFI